MSDDFEQKKRNVINALNGVLRTSALKDQDIGQQRLVLLVDQLLDRSRKKGRLQLAPVYEYLKEKQLEEDAILETLLVFKEREPTLEIGLDLPPALEHLSKDRRQRLLLRYQKRQRAPRTKVPAPSQTDIPLAEPQRPVVAAGKGRTRLLGALLLLALTIAVGAMVWREQTAEPAAVAVVVDDPMGLPCKELKGNHGVLMCWMERARFDAIGPSERKTRGGVTKAAAAGLGYKTLQVWTVEDTRLREVH